MRTSLSCNGWRGAFHMPIRPREMDFADWSIVYVVKCLWEPIAPRNEGTIAVADALSIAPAPRNPPTDSGTFRSIIWRNFAAISSSACSRGMGWNEPSRSEEHTYELHSLMRIPDAAFRLK